MQARVHMRVLRRITDCINGVSKGDNVSNVAVRRMVAEPSVDCMMTRARLMYAQRVLVNGPDSLNALQWNSGAPLRWAIQVKKDVIRMQHALGNGFLSTWTRGKHYVSVLRTHGGSALKDFVGTRRQPTRQLSC